MEVCWISPPLIGRPIDLLPSSVAVVTIYALSADDVRLDRIDTIINVKIFPTENVEKVKKAVQNLFPTACIAIISQHTGAQLCAKVEGKRGLTNFLNRLREEKILAAARKVFRRGLVEKFFTFYLNKQAAYVNRISFCESAEESPLGCIEVRVACDDPKKLIHWLSRKHLRQNRTKKA